MKEYMFLVDWGKVQCGGRYGVICAKSMWYIFSHLDAVADPVNAKLKQINYGNDHDASFYLDLTDPMSGDNDNSFNDPLIEADNFDITSEEYRKIKAREEDEEYPEWHEGGKENGWYSFIELSEAMPNYASKYKGQRVNDIPFEELEERDEEHWHNNVFQMFLEECHVENEYRKSYEPETLQQDCIEVIDF